MGVGFEVKSARHDDIVRYKAGGLQGGVVEWMCCLLLLASRAKGCA